MHTTRLLHCERVRWLTPALALPLLSASSASLVAARPFASVRALQAAARITFLRDTPVTGWLEALSNHPRIGGDVAALRERFRATAGWAEGEQSGAWRVALAALLGNASAYVRDALGCSCVLTLMRAN